MHSKRLRSLLIIIVSLLVLFSIFVFSFNLINKLPIQQILLDKICDSTSCDIQLEKFMPGFWGGIGIQANNFKLNSRLGPNQVTAEKIRIIFSFKDLVKGQLVPHKIFLLRPEIDINIKRQWGMSSQQDPLLLKKMIMTRLAGISSITLSKARIHFMDLPFDLDNVHLLLARDVHNEGMLRFRFRGKYKFQTSAADFDIKGLVDQNTPSAQLTLTSGKFPFSWVPWPRYLTQPEGQAEAKIVFSYSYGKPVSAKGHITAYDPHLLMIKAEKEKDYAPGRLVLDFSGDYSNKVLGFDSLNVKGDDFSLSFKLGINFKDSENIHLNFEMASPFMDSGLFIKLFPTPILPKFFETRLFPVFKMGSVRLDHLRILGPLKKIRKLKKPGNQDCLDMLLTIKDLDVCLEGTSSPFKHVNGQVSINNGNLLISGIEADLENSNINDASLDIRNVYQKGRLYLTKIEGFFDLQDLRQLSSMDYLSGTFKKRIGKIKSIKGEIQTCMQIAYQKGWKYPRPIRGTIDFIDCFLNHEKLFFPLIIKESKLLINDDRKNEIQAQGLWGDSQFRVSSFFEDFEHIHTAKISARADLNQIIGLFDNNLPKKIAFNNLVNCHFIISRGNQSWKGDGKFDLGGQIIETKSFIIGPFGNEDFLSINLDILPKKKLRIHEIKLFTGPSEVSLSGFCGLENRDHFDFELCADRLSLDDLAIQSRTTGERATGLLVCQIDGQIFTKDPLKSSLSGHIKARGFSFVLKDMPSPINDLDLNIEFSGQRVQIHSFNFNTGQSQLGLNGHFMSRDDSLQGDLMINSEYLDLEDFKIKTGDINTKSFLFACIKKTSLGLKIKVNKSRWKNMKFGLFEATGRLIRGKMNIEQAMLNMDHGEMKVKGDLDLINSFNKSFSIYLNLVKQPLNELFPFFELKNRFMGGDLSIEGLCFIEGKTMADIISGMTGSFNLLLENGNIIKSNILIKILDFFSLQKIFKGRPPDLVKEGFYYNEIKGNLVIIKGVLETESLVMKSPVLNAVAKGNINMNTGWLDCGLGVQPLETIDWVIANLPVVGYILAGKDKKLLIYYFTAKGPLTSPKIKYIPLKNIGGKIIGFFKRFFLSPIHLFKEMSRIAQDLVKMGIPLPDDSIMKD